MATLSVQNPTLLDLANVSDPDGKISTVVEILNETNEVLADMSWMEGNLPTGHKTTIRSGIPAPTWRKLYGGVQPNKSTTVQVTDNTGMLEAYAEVDKALADLNGNTAAFRLQEDKPHIEGMNQEIVDTLFFGDESTEPEAFTGLAPRFANLSSDENSDNIINGAGSGSDNASIWLVVWGPNTCHGIIPKGSTAGLQMTDKGQVTLEDASDGSNTGRMEAYRTHYRWDAGLTVRDWRYIVRIANIDRSLLSATYSSGAFSSGAHIPDLMFQSMRLVPNLSMGRPAFYMSRDILTWVGRQTAAAVQGSTLTTDMVGGKLVESFHGIPMRRVDALAGDEAALT
mgnify:CR=1 FL=1|jgi:hypothetical protein|tara:strand:+ start:3448 stop:4470 length:1023 start_codon:yes stop_codon:yes gene_type:complete